MDREYEGLVTRAIAFAIDAAIINVVAIVVAAGMALALSVLHLPSGFDPVLVACGATAYALWSLGYFVLFWSSTGQTPGDRVMRIRVQVAAGGGGPPRPARAVIRMGGLLLAALPLFAGFLTILVDDRRRGLHDMIAGTVVVAAREEPLPPLRGRDDPALLTRIG